MKNLIKLLSTLTLSLMIVACTTTPVTNADGDTFQDIQTKLLGDMPIPGGAVIIHDKSLILGSGDTWAGRVAISTVQNSTETFTFFREQFQKSGWTLVSSTKTKNSILVFIKKDRTATIEIEDGSMLGKTGVMLTVAPRSTVTPPVGK